VYTEFSTKIDGGRMKTMTKNDFGTFDSDDLLGQAMLGMRGYVSSLC
jgi:hypothetical protein